MRIERIREKLQELLDKRGVSMRGVSLRAGLTHNTIRNMLLRNKGRVNYTFLDAILKVLGVTMAEFWEPDDGPAKPPDLTAPPGMRLGALPATPAVLVPDCGLVSAGPLQMPDPAAAERFYAGSRGDENSFVLTVAGDSMTPDYVAGEVIFLRRESIHLVPLPEGVKVGVPYDHVVHLNKKDCVVYMDGEGCTFKRLRMERGRSEDYTLTLLPVNPSHNRTVIRPEHDLWIQGVCYKSIRKH